MYELFAYPNTYAIGVHLLLHESGVAYRVIDVSKISAEIDQADSTQRSAAENFKAASPHQRVPALRLPDGSSQFESGAIALHLGDSLYDGKFGISAASTFRPAYLQWLFYLSSTLQPEVMLQFHPEHYFADTATQQSLKEASMRRLDEIWPILESCYSTGPWMFDNRPTAVDFSLATVLLWPECFPENSKRYPNLNRTLESIKSREACQEVLHWHAGAAAQTDRSKQLVS